MKAQTLLRSVPEATSSSAAATASIWKNFCAQITNPFPPCRRSTTQFQALHIKILTHRASACQPTHIAEQGHHRAAHPLLHLPLINHKAMAINVPTSSLTKVRFSSVSGVQASGPRRDCVNGERRLFRTIANEWMVQLNGLMSIYV